MIADVAVVGAGPTGAAAAIGLARAGRTVVLVDKATFPRDKICGDALTAGALRLLDELGLDPATIGTWQATDRIVLRDPRGREIAYTLPEDGSFAVASRRVDLDAGLVALAADAGAEVRSGNSVEGIEVHDDRVVVQTGTDRLTARYVVAADGMWSAVRRLLGVGPPGYRGDAHAFRQYLGGVSEHAVGELFVSFEEDLLPGYFWSFPLGGGAVNIGIGVHRRGPVRHMGAQWRAVLERPHIRAFLGPDARPEGPHRAWPIPTRLPGLPLSGAGGRVLFVGDAAGATDPMSGEGIGQALHTGLLAAASITHGHPHDPVGAARRYEAEVQRSLVPDHRMSAALVRLLSTPRGATFAVSASGATAWTRRNFARWLFEDEPRGVLLTPARWHRRFLARPGAFSGT